MLDGVSMVAKFRVEIAALGGARGDVAIAAWYVGPALKPPESARGSARIADGICKDFDLWIDRLARLVIGRPRARRRL